MEAFYFSPCLLRQSVNRAPFGASAWVQRTARRLGFEASLRPRGQPRKVAAPR